MRMIAHLFVLLLLSLLHSPTWAVQISQVRLWPAPEHTRLVLDLSEPVAYRLFALQQPPRWVVDLPNSQLQADLSELILLNSGIKALRSGQLDADTLRLVIDLHQPLQANSFLLPPNDSYGHRLVIDLQHHPLDTAQTPPAQPPEPKTAAPPKTDQAITTQRRDLIIAIDAGHGGEDPGAIGPKGVYEKTVVLAIAQKLKLLIDAEPGYKGVLLRTSDYYIPLQRRRELAREQQADLFVSIHADAFKDRRAHGASVYALSLSGATSTTARFLADQENAADIIGGVGGVSLQDKDPVLQSVLLDLSMTATLNASLQAGALILQQLGSITPLHKRHIEQAGFAVLKSPDVPSVLVETGFISNPKEEQRLTQSSHQHKLARSIFHGIKQYFQRNPTPGTWVAWQQQAFSSYRVQAGDTLSQIALRFNSSIEQIVTANQLSSTKIRAGQTLKIPQN